MMQIIANLEPITHQSIKEIRMTTGDILSYIKVSVKRMNSEICLFVIEEQTVQNSVTVIHGGSELYFALSSILDVSFETSFSVSMAFFAFLLKGFFLEVLDTGVFLLPDFCFGFDFSPAPSFAFRPLVIIPLYGMMMTKDSYLWLRAWPRQLRQERSSSDCAR